MKSYSQEVCLRIIAKLDVKKLNARNCITKCGGNKSFEVKHCGSNQIVVYLIERTCTYLRWQFTRIPYSHVVLTIYKDNGRPNPYMNVVFSRKTFLKCCDYQIHPMPGEEMWLECNYAKIKPPHMKTLIRRPKKKRIGEEGDPNNLDRISKRGIKMKCSKCG